MAKPTWKMAWGKLPAEFDAGNGRKIGSHIILSGSVLGMRLLLDEVVTERTPFATKAWETVGEPRLLVIGPYRMGFTVTPEGAAALLKVAIDYELPADPISRFLGRIFGRSYANWCTRQMVQDAQRHFSRSTVRPFPP